MNGEVNFLVHEFVFMSHLGKGELNCKTHGLTLPIGNLKPLFGVVTKTSKLNSKWTQRKGRLRGGI
jgi:hypothetical protein